MLLPISKSLLAANIILPTLALLAVSFRIAARRKKHLPLGGDDYAILVALFLAIGVCIAGIVAAVTNINARSIFTLSAEDRKNHAKLLWVDVLLCHLVYGVIKISILLFYKRIFVTPWFRRTVWCLIGFVMCWMIAAFFGQLFSTHPIEGFWENPEQSYVIDFQLFLFVMATLDILLDVLTLLLPLPVIRGLHMSTKKKVQLACVFLLGFFCVISSAVRCWYCWQLRSLIKEIYRTRADPTDIFAQTDLWGHVEACVSIVTACLPTIAPLLAGKTLSEGLLGGIRTFFTLRSSSILSFRRGAGSTHADRETSLESMNAKQKWYKMTDMKNESGNVVESYSMERMVDSDQPSGIMVSRAFETRRDG